MAVSGFMEQAMIHKGGKYPHLDRTNRLLPKPSSPLGSQYQSVLTRSSKLGITKTLTQAGPSGAVAHYHRRGDGSAPAPSGGY